MDHSEDEAPKDYLCPMGCGMITDGRPCWECLAGNYGIDTANHGGFR